MANEIHSRDLGITLPEGMHEMGEAPRDGTHIDIWFITEVADSDKGANLNVGLERVTNCYFDALGRWVKESWVGGLGKNRYMAKHVVHREAVAWAPVPEIDNFDVPFDRAIDLGILQEVETADEDD